MEKETFCPWNMTGSVPALERRSGLATKKDISLLEELITISYVLHM